jgi:SNF family Na+-dependent transporter
MLVIIILCCFLAVAGWVSYYTSASVYRSLDKNDNRYARVFQVLTFAVIFVGLVGAGLFLLLNNLAFQR